MFKKRAENKGQIIAVFAVSLLALLFFVGLALDAGSVYVTYGSLKRTVDSASIAAAPGSIPAATRSLIPC